jgi:hypothetical protein
MEGCYVEFGVAFGNSLRAAELAIKHGGFEELGVAPMKRKLFGFDSFEGFISADPIDEHPTWQGQAFSANHDRVLKRFKNSPTVNLIKVDLNLLRNGDASLTPAHFGIDEPAALILFDVDLYLPTFAALLFSSQIMQEGTYLMFDEYYSFGGRLDRGERKAIVDFLKVNPNISFERVSTYGAGGCVFMVHMK